MSRTRGGGKPLAGTFTAGEWTVLLELNSLERNGRSVRLEPKLMQVLEKDHPSLLRKSIAGF